MRDGWTVHRLADVVEVTMGRQRSPRHATGEHLVPYLRAANVKDGRLDLSDVKSMNFTPAEQTTFTLRHEDVLVTEGCGSIAQVGAAAVWRNEISGPVCFQNTLLRLRAKPATTLPGFVWVWASHAFASGLFAAVASGTNIFHIGSLRAQEMSILVPPLDEQRRIVDLIDAVDQVTHAASKLYVQAGDLLASLRATEVSAGDVTVPLADAFTLQRGFDLPAASRVGGDHPVIASSGPVGVHGEAKVIGPGVVTGRSGTIGVVQYIEEDFWPLNTTLFVKDFKGNEPRYVARVLEGLELARFAGGSTVPSLDRKVLAKVPIYLPAVDEQRRIADLLDEVGRTRDSAWRYTAAAAEFRASILAGLLSGEHEIPESYGELLEAV